MTRKTSIQVDGRTYTLSDDLTCFACQQPNTQSLVEDSVTVKQANKTKGYFQLETVCLSDVCNGDHYEYVWSGKLAETEIVITEKLVVPF